MVPFVLFGGAALFVDGPQSSWLAGLLAAAFLAACLGGMVLVPNRRMGLGLTVPLVVLVLGWWVRIPPGQDRDWMADVSRPPEAVVQGSMLTIRNVRNFQYRSEMDFDENWETRTWDLDELLGVNLVLSYWGTPYIAHTIMSWEFAEGPPLAISIETRKEQGEAYSPVLGFFRQYELYYVVGDERDVLGVRSHHRGETLYMYRLRVDPPTARALLLDYVERINALAAEPAWYNAAAQNCTTTIRVHMQHVGRGNFWDPRLLINGRIDELGYERGALDQTLPMAVLRERSRFDSKVSGAPIAEDYSRRIREGLPGAFPEQDS